MSLQQRSVPLYVHFEILEKIEDKDPFKSAVRAENGNNVISKKYYDKIIEEKKKEL